MSRCVKVLTKWRGVDVNFPEGNLSIPFLIRGKTSVSKNRVAFLSVRKLFIRKSKINSVKGWEKLSVLTLTFII